MRLAFEPDACAREAELLVAQYPELGSVLDPSSIRKGGTYVSEDLLLDRGATFEEYRWSFDLGPSSFEFGMEVPVENLPISLELVRRLLTSDDPEDALAFIESLGMRWPRRFLSPGSKSAAQWPAVTAPGVYRREHASVMVRSREAAFLVDPLCMAPFAWPSDEPPRGIGVADLAAICVTHTHLDHYNLPSILHFLGGDHRPTVLVPKVPTTSHLCRRVPERELTDAGIEHRVAEWGTTIKIRDTEIDVLPFFGEQLSRYSTKVLKRGLRNWGSCYRFNTPDFSVIVIADSGVDGLGSMLDVCEESSKRRGPPDLILSAMRSFGGPLDDVIDLYMALPFDDLRASWDRFQQTGQREHTMLGPAGIDELLDRTGAKYFAPYAQGYAGLSVPIPDVGLGAGEPSERELLGELLRLREGKRSATVMPWLPADGLVPRSGGLEIERASGPKDA